MDYSQSNGIPQEQNGGGQLTTATQVVSLKGKPLPAVLTLNSTAAGRKIELSTDGNNYFPVTLDANVTGCIVLNIQSKAMFARLTGNVGDTWSLL